VAYGAKMEMLLAARRQLDALWASPSQLRQHELHGPRDGARRSAAELLGHPGIDLARLSRIWPELGAIRSDVAEQLEIDGQYAGYLERQEADIRAFRREERLTLPADLDYGVIAGLSAEMRNKFSAIKPPTLGAASRVPGVTPAALIALLRFVRRDELPVDA
jgi:tRNA uridine 5-carboxymethylaminomethyl modification enzyme